MATSSATSSTLVPSSPDDPARAQAEARAAVLASLESEGSKYDAKYKQRSADIHTNSTAISKQEADLKNQTTGLGKESAKLQKEVDKAMKGMKDFGDQQNWAEKMEREFMVLEETLRLVEGREEGESASGGSAWREESGY